MISGQRFSKEKKIQFAVKTSKKKKNQQNCLQIKGTAWGTVEDFPLCITGASINEAVHSGCNWMGGGLQKSFKLYRFILDPSKFSSEHDFYVILAFI